jgi:hypothetical protein
MDFPLTTQAGKLAPQSLQVVSYSLTLLLQFLPGHFTFSPGVYLGGCFVNILTAISTYFSLSSAEPIPSNFTKALEHYL